MRQVEAVLEQLGFQNHLVVDREVGAAIFFWIKGKQPSLGAEFFGEAAAKLIFLGVFARRPGSRPAQVLVSLELLRHPGGDLFAKFHDMGWVGAIR